VSRFRRRRRGDDEAAATGAEQPDEQFDDYDDAEATDDPGSAAAPEVDDGPADVPAASRAGGAGPWDVSDVDDPAASGRLNFGGIWIPGAEGLEVRVEADNTTGQVIAVTLVLGDGALQVQPFAAPRTEGIWDEVRAEIRAGITQQGGTADEVDGPLGPELRTKVPVRAADGSSGIQPARFLGVDGPRWFLRAVITGRPAVDAGTDSDLIALLREVVVVRGADPMAPRDPIPLTLPDETGAGAGESGTDADEQDVLNPFARGPEITEIR
jgi:hypothetical protein